MSNSTNWVSHTPDRKPPQTQNRPSPPSAFEKFFFPVIEDQQAFTQTARQVSESNSRSQRTLEASSVHTQDFETAAEEISEHEYFDDISIDRDIYQDDILGLVSPISSILEEIQEPEHSPMGSRRSKKSKVAKSATVSVTKKTMEPTKPDPTPTPTEESAHFDVLDHVYEHAKGAWAFGKGVVVFKPFMGLAEAVAEKAVSIVGLESLENVDKNIIPHLKGIDKEFIDPAILKIWSLLEPVVGKSEDVAKSMIAMVHKQPKIESDKVKECKEVTSPEISTPAVAAA